MEAHNTCPVFGHHSIKITKELKVQVFDCFEKLILEYNTYVFCFFEFGDFENMCLEILTDLKTHFPYIQSVICLANSTSAEEFNSLSWTLFFDKIEDIHPSVNDFDIQSIPKQKKYHKLFRDNYITAIIDSCDYCIFCYSRNDLLHTKKKMQRPLIFDIEKSFAYNYAIQTQKNIMEIIES